MSEREELEDKLISVERFEPRELSQFSLEDLRYFWNIYLFETRKHRNDEEDVSSDEVSSES